MSENNMEQVFKLLLIGDSGVGKSSILLRFTKDDFAEDIGTTIGVDFMIKYVSVQKKRVKLTIWDTAGQERFRTLTSSYYRGAQGVILVYDIASKESFENLKDWLKEVDAYCSYPDIVKLLVGNKIDLDEEREVSRKEGEQFAKENSMLFIECSAKTKVGIDQTFDEVAHKIMDTETLIDSSKSGSSTGNVNINEERENNEEEGWCCF